MAASLACALAERDVELRFGQDDGVLGGIEMHRGARDPLVLRLVRRVRARKVHLGCRYGSDGKGVQKPQ